MIYTARERLEQATERMWERKDRLEEQERFREFSEDRVEEMAIKKEKCLKQAKQNREGQR